MFNNTYELINAYNNIFSKNYERFLSPTIKSPNYDFDNYNQINSIYEANQLNNIYHISSHYLINQAEIEKKNILKDTKSTISNTYKEKEENDEPVLFTPYDILNIFNKESNKDKFSNNIKKLKFKKDIEDNLQLTGRKRKREDFENENNKSNELEDNKKKKKRGREKNNLNRFEIHDKMCPDNIIRKVKSSIFNYILYFLNNLLSSADEFYSLYNVKLLKLDYKFIRRLQKEQEFKILSMSLKDIFSKDISPKLKKYKSNFNKQVIDNLLKNEKVNDTILFVFNMTLRNWLDIFTLKKSVIDITNEYKDKNYKDIESEKIEKCLVGVDKLINEIKEKNSEDYLPYFIFCLYNYERWFYLKKSGTIKKKNNKLNED